MREKQAIALPEAIRMLTSRPAEVFGITDRGRLASGLAADVVVFDPATVGASKLRRVHDLPAGADRLVADASGIEAVIVNGTIDPARRARRGRAGRRAAGGPAAQRQREGDEPSSLTLS